MIQQQLNDFEEREAHNAHHRALILRILKDFSEGLTTQQIIQMEVGYYGYQFLSDNRLRELRKLNLVYSVKVGKSPIVWRRT